MKAIGIDIGTTSICGVVINIESGEILHSVTKNSNAFIETSAEWEKTQSVDRIITIATDLLNSLIDSDVKVIGVSGQMHGILYTDDMGNAVSPLYTWQDGRGNLPYKDTTYANYLGSFSGYGNVTDFYNRENGIRPKGASSYCTIHDYFVMKLCGLVRPIIHTSNAASFGLYDLKNNKFNYDFDNEVTKDYRIAGSYHKIPVAVAIGDNQASVFSTLQNDSKVLINIGTGSQVSIISNAPIVAKGIEVRPYFDDKYLVVGSALCGGRAYSILKNFYSKIFEYIGKVDDERVYDIMNSMISDNLTEPLTVDTRFAGSRGEPDIRGSISNITTENFTPQNLTYGVLNGMAEELFLMYLEMKEERCGIVGSGNGIRKNPALIKVFEEKFGSKMLIPKHVEEAAFGAALYGIVASGIVPCSKDAQNLIKYL